MMPPLPDVRKEVYENSGLLLSAAEEISVVHLMRAYGRAVAEACAQIAESDSRADPDITERIADAIREMAKEIK